ncbi:MAG: helix-turn-helix transcriptional regulator, partial [Clostridia bacterium]|nr:helix-turn-helix transcriptional regulator [Clostridia bacterium]
MKTTDLIPILLYQLKDSDKYGLELVQACNECSNGKIDIKQPSLYSILKKLEKSHFISSYWKDSDIGGKRHYYKITENGLFQLETYPPLEELINNAINDDNEKIEDDIIEEDHKKIEVDNSPTPFDNLELNFSSPSSKDEELNESNPFDIFLAESPISSENNIQESSTNELLNNLDDTLTNNDEEDEEVNITTEEAQNENNDTSLELEPQLNLNNDEKIDVNNVENDSQEEIDNIDESDLNDEEILPKSDSENRLENKSSFSIFDALNYADEEIEDEQEVNNMEIKEQASLTLNNPFFKDNNEKSLSEKTNLEINEDNIKLLENDDKTEDFAESVKVTSFTQKQIQPIEISSKKTLSEIPEDIGVSPNIENSNIEFKDYVDFKNDKNIKQAKSIAKIKITKTLLSSLITLAMVIFTFSICLKHDITFIYGVSVAISTLYVVFYSSYMIG